MSEFEAPKLVEPGHTVTVDEVRELVGAATPHFATHISGRLQRLVAPLDANDPARQLAEREIGRLHALAVEGESRGGSVPSQSKITG